MDLSRKLDEKLRKDCVRTHQGKRDAQILPGHRHLCPFSRRQLLAKEPGAFQRTYSEVDRPHANYTVDDCFFKKGLARRYIRRM